MGTIELEYSIKAFANESSAIFPLELKIIEFLCFYFWIIDCDVQWFLGLNNWKWEFNGGVFSWELYSEFSQSIRIRMKSILSILTNVPRTKASEHFTEWLESSTKMKLRVVIIWVRVSTPSDNSSVIKRWSEKINFILILCISHSSASFHLNAVPLIYVLFNG